MKVRIELSLDIDDKKWAQVHDHHDRGLPSGPAYVRREVRAWVDNQINQQLHDMGVLREVSG